ncbi:MAG: endopeptidase La [Planctomycetota bacterium]|jgi:ATP-dependent Lon protease
MAEEQKKIAMNTKAWERSEFPENLGVLPVRGLVLFPGLTVPLTIGRPRSLKLIDEVLPQEEKIIAVTTIKPEGENEEEPGPEYLYRTGSAVRILKMAKVLPDRYQIIVMGLSRVRIRDFTATEPYITAKVTAAPESTETGAEVDAMGTNLKAQFRKWAELRGAPEPLIFAVEQEENLHSLVYVTAAQIGIPVPSQQEILKAQDLKEKLRLVTEHLTREIDHLNLAQEIQGKIKDGMEKSQREYLLREQMKMIQKELGEEDPQAAEVKELQKRVEEAELPEEAKKVAERELGRLGRIPTASPEYTVARTYLDWILEVPWSRQTEDRLDIEKARKILNDDHYDLEKVKKRILEYLAVRKLKNDMRGPILCFVGPPGVGKTSLGQSIARSLGRKFIRLSLGGVRDEAEIRGHRRTYVGALPGRILQGLRKAGSNNPVFMLDEVDKIGLDFRGDPASALLEVLDPEQNFSFSDHYLEIPFDLSRVMFITTANVLHTIPPPLRDRMEILDLPGYTDREKLHIAKRYLVPRQLKEHGLVKKNLTFTDQALLSITRSYTREAGVRNLEREIAGVCRAVATRVASGKKKPVRVTPKRLHEFLGPVKFLPETEVRQWGPGLATGLAWTPVGGETLFVEVGKMPGKGRFTMTGQLGEVMRESVTAAFSFLKSHAGKFGIEPEAWETQDIHVHIPAGAIPKDGPSAGVAMLSALASALVEKPVDKDLCMTGEVTLRGDVLPVGGIKEKVLAAKRAGIDTVILPRLNEKDLLDLPDPVRKGMEFILVDRMEKALVRAIPGLKKGKGRGRAASSRKSGGKKARSGAGKAKRVAKSGAGGKGSRKASPRAARKR